jgi:hypothetical protein
MSFLYPYIYFIAGSFIASLLVYLKPNRYYRSLKLFPPFLLATFSAEFYGSYLSYSGENNLILYNFFTVVEFCFYLFIIRVVLKNPRVRKILFICIILYGITAVLNILFFQGMNTFHTVTYAMGCLLIVFFCIYYFLELFRFPKSEKLITNPSFWICTGLLFFYCCGFPLYGLINSWGNISKLIVDNFGDIVTILNIFLYSLFTIAFICTRIRKYTLSSS